MAIKFLNTVAVDTNVLFVDTTNNRVGINTASPTRALQVGDGSTDESIGVYHSDGSYMRLHGYGVYMSRTSSYIRPVTTNAQSLYVGHSSHVWNAISNNATTHYFRKGTDEHMRITSTGNVGIGTTSPGSKLHIASAMGTAGQFDGAQLRLDTTNTVDTTGFQGMRFQTSTAPNYGWTMGVNRSSAGRGSFRFYEHNNSATGTERFTILQDGNVGIGTVSPSEKLHVVGYAKADTGFKAGNYTILNESGNETSLSNTAYYPMFFKTNNSTRMTISNAGNVGIGTTSPLVELEVDGSIMASGSSGGALRLNANSASSSGVRNSIVSTTQNGLTPPQGELKWEAGQYGGASVWTTRLHNAPYTTSYINLPHSSTGGNFVVNIESVNRLTIDRANGNVSIGSLNTGALHTNYSGASFNTNLGFENFNNGFAALATGQLTLADANLSTSMGYQCKALGIASLAGGNTNGSTLTEAAGEASLAFGNGVKTSSNANYSQAFGRGTVTGGGATNANQAMAIGYQTTAWADNSFAGGNDSNAFGEESFAFGTGSTASKGDANIALGLGITTNTSATAAIGAGQVAVGKYNNFSSGVAHNFAVGTGFSDTIRITGFCVTDVGYTGIGTTDPGSKLDMFSATNPMVSSLLRLRTTFNGTNPEKVAGFYVNTNTERGFIAVNQYAVTYSTSSDYRLKENIVPISNGIERLKELKPCRFNFIEGDPNYVVDGFIAHEAAEVVPEAVTGEKDAVDEDNNPSYQGIDQSKVVPLLTAALQEAISKIEQLEIRIQTLENN
jgi:hypothetical protein